MPYISLFIYGFLSAAAALLLQILLTIFFTPEVNAGIAPTLISSSTLFLIAAAFLEESSKWVFFRQFEKRFRENLPSPSALNLGIIFGIGFSAMEIGLILFNLKSLALVPLAGIVGLHLLTSLFYAYYLFRPAPRASSHALFLLVLTTFLHTCYNLFLAQ